jgi:hypothetical protein
METANGMTKIKNVYNAVKNSPGISSSEVAKNLNESLPRVWNILHSLRRGHYVKHEVVSDPVKGRYFKYYPTTKYISTKSKRLTGTTHPITKKRRKKYTRKMKTPAIRNNTLPVMPNRVRVVVALGGKEFAMPLRAAREIYTQLKEIFT